jgi:hypoxanthine phosphoribosyltransferase
MIIRDKNFIKYLDQEDIQKTIRRLGRGINQDYKEKEPLLLAVLNGSFIFAADLIRELKNNVRISFVKVASYHEMESTGNIKQLIGLNENIFNQDVLIIEDIIDSGQTIGKMIEMIEGLGARSIEIVSLLRKPKNNEFYDRIRYVGFDIPDKFVIGYGLDYEGRGRNLKHIYQLK